MTDQKKSGPASCPPGEECSPSCCSEPQKETNTTFKWGVFIAVMVLAIAIGGYSLMKKNSPARQDANRQFISDPETASLAAEPNKVVCGETLTSLRQLNVLGPDKNVAYILLPGESDSATQDISNKVNAFVDRTIKQQKDIAKYTMNKNAEGYDVIVRDFAITTFPSVIVLGRGCRSSAITTDFTEAKFANALSIARIPLGSCRPGDKCGATCGPKKK